MGVMERSMRIQLSPGIREMGLPVVPLRVAVLDLALIMAIWVDELSALFPKHFFSPRDWFKYSTESLCLLFYPTCQLNHFISINGGFFSALTAVIFKELNVSPS